MFFKMAWRNLWRNARRTTLTVAVISLGLSLLIIMISFTEGMKDMMVEQVARSSIGHIQLHHPEYLERKSVGLVIPDAQRVVALTESVDGVAAVSPRLVLSGSIGSSRSSSSQVVQILAVDPVRERQFSGLAEKVVEGGFVVPPQGAEDPDAPARFRRRGLLMGTRLAELLKVKIGSKVSVSTAALGPQRRASEGFIVTGLMKTGMNTMDKGLVLVSLPDMQEVTHASDAVHEISVMVDDPGNIEAVTLGIRQAVSRIDGPAREQVQTLPWWEISPDIKQMLDMSDGWVVVLYLLMMVIMSAGILTTMFMVVFERKREFGIQIALGTSPRMLFVSVLLEAVFVAAVSSVVGLAVGGVAVAFLVKYGLDLTFLMEGVEFAGLFIENVYKGSASARVFVEPTVVVVVSTLLFALWPALRVARMKALDGIREGATRG